jgi:hypothetical protein
VSGETKFAVFALCFNVFALTLALVNVFVVAH